MTAPPAPPDWEPPRRPRRGRLLALTLTVTLLAGVAVATMLGSGGMLEVDERPTPSPGPDVATVAQSSAELGRWSPRVASPPPVPGAHTAVWTADGLLAWGAGAEALLYRPADARWSTLPPPPLEPRLAPALQWTGRRALVWGGERPDGSAAADGAAFDPARQRWDRLPDAPFGIWDAVTAWTGTHFVAWGRLRLGDHEPAGLELDLARGRWRELPPAPVEAIETPAGAWTGRELLVWGRDRQRRGFLLSYDPAARAWERLAAPPLARPAGAAAAWAGDDDGRGELVLWGRPLLGQRSGAPPAGAAYDPRAPGWRLLPYAPGYAHAGSGWSAHGLSATWTGRRVVVVGGYPRSVTLSYEPAADAWDPLPALPGVVYPTLHWTGPTRWPDGRCTAGELLVWGGYGPYGPTASLRSWTPDEAPADDGPCRQTPPGADRDCRTCAAT